MSKAMVYDGYLIEAARGDDGLLRLVIMPVDTDKIVSSVTVALMPASGSAHLTVWERARAD